MKKLLLALLFCCPVFADEPDDPVPSPDEIPRPVSTITDLEGEPIARTVQIGEPIYLSAVKAKYARSVNGSILWRVFPPERGLTAREADNGELFILGTGSKPITITVQQIVSLNDVVATTEIQIRVEGPEPLPPPKPDPCIPPKPIPPEPGPDPPEPDPTPKPVGLLTKLKEVTAEFVGSLPSEEKAAVAAVYRSVAKNAVAGQITTMDSMVRATADGVRGSLGAGKLIPWLRWRDAVTDVLEADGRYKTPAANAAVWDSLADILEGKAQKRSK